MVEIENIYTRDRRLSLINFLAPVLTKEGFQNVIDVRASNSDISKYLNTDKFLGSIIEVHGFSAIEGNSKYVNENVYDIVSRPRDSNDAMKILKETKEKPNFKKIALFVPVDTLFGKERAKFFRHYRPDRVYFCNKRPNYLNSRGKIVSDTKNYIWIVYDNTMGKKNIFGRCKHSYNMEWLGI